MISAAQGVQVLASAITSGEWVYTQGGAQGGPEPAVDLAAHYGDCTDFTFAATTEGVGNFWNARYPRDKPNTTMLFNGRDGAAPKGYTWVDADKAQTGDILVTKPHGHAGLFIGRDKSGNMVGWANNGLPATPDRTNKDNNTTFYNFGQSPRVLRPIVLPVGG